MSKTAIPTNTDIRSRQALINYLSQEHGAKAVNYLFFWGHTPKQPNQIDKSCLSQWYPASFEIAGIHYPTAEHYMMAEKARLFADEQCLEKILQASSPAQAKKLGRQIEGFEQAAWDARCMEIVIAGNTAKFAQNSDLLEFLHSTGTRILVEASPHDRIWGIGLTADNPKALDPVLWQGDNLLGFALMAVRQQLCCV